MFEIKKEVLFKDTDKILYNIMLLLQEQNKILTAQSLPQMASEAKDVDCKYCGKTHKNRYQVAACAKKLKRKSIQNQRGGKHDKDSRETTV